jgi:hypothetical protein
MMAYAGFGLNVVSALSFTLVSFVCFAFVDDTDLIHCSRSTDTSGETLVPEVQACLDHWESPQKKLLVLN